ncbi:MAG: GGDEF domain-containing phosphodiesterase, partial [Chromatiaceae bacterium]|nr:GGDEF domain-containing phosphodiesterase [Chromatiaceae bacterium]
LAGRLRRALHKAEFVARAGSDEFALLLTELANTAEAIDRARAIQRRIAQVLAEQGGEQAGGQDGEQAGEQVGPLDGEQAAELGSEPVAAGSARLEIELLEIARLDNAVAAAVVMRDCKRLGVRFSLDDFGTGYASLTYFHQLPIDVVKIDRRFVLNMLDNAEDRAIVEGVLLMSRTLPRPVLAEGVESFEIGQLLQQMGCEYAQGFGIARPMPAEQVLPWLSAWAKERRWHQRATDPKPPNPDPSAP